MNENYHSLLKVSGSTFIYNVALFGGGMSMYDSSIYVDNCSFIDNLVR
jgi:hypothetical protein